ncbi:hypothetical protein ACFX2A_000319 [Malus domestica]
MMGHLRLSLQHLLESQKAAFRATSSKSCPLASAARRSSSRFCRPWSSLRLCCPRAQNVQLSCCGLMLLLHCQLHSGPPPLSGLSRDFWRLALGS